MADTVLAALRRGADAGASFRVVGETDRSMADILEEVEARARGLVAAGLQPRERVGVALPNGMEVLLWVYSVIAAGGSTVFIPPYAKPAEVAALAEKAQARWVISAREGEQRVISAGRAAAMFADAPGTPLPEAGLDWEAGCFTTSGSTGTPKLAALTHAAWDAGISAMQAVTGDRLGDVCLFAMPMCHVAFLPNVHAFLARGGRVVHVPVFDAQGAVRAAAEEKAAYMSGSPAMFGLILKRCSLPDPQLRFRRVCYGAGAMPAHWAAELAAALDCEVCHGYGLTESGGFVAFQEPQEHMRKPGPVGKTTPPFEPVRIRAVEADHDCGVDEVGEILIRGESVMSGYVADPEETAATIVDDGWVRTGDLGRLDAEGDLWIVGRLKDQINRGGLKIGAREVEVVIEALPGVQGVGVVGVPDPVLQERVAAVIEAENGAVTAQGVREACAKVLADHKVPERIEIVPAMPRTSVGKPDKPAMRRMLAESR
jgi:long-chain acyl-CoA synthetase